MPVASFGHEGVGEVRGGVHYHCDPHLSFFGRISASRDEWKKYYDVETGDHVFFSARVCKLHGRGSENDERNAACPGRRLSKKCYCFGLPRDESDAVWLTFDGSLMSAMIYNVE